MPVIQTNIAFALGVKAIFLALAFSGHRSIWLAILADTDVPVRAPTEVVEGAN